MVKDSSTKFERIFVTLFLVLVFSAIAASLLSLLACGTGDDIQISNENHNEIEIILAEQQQAEEEQKDVCQVCREKFNDPKDIGDCYDRHPSHNCGDVSEDDASGSSSSSDSNSSK